MWDTWVSCEGTDQSGPAIISDGPKEYNDLADAGIEDIAMDAIPSVAWSRLSGALGGYPEDPEHGYLPRVSHPDATVISDSAARGDVARSRIAGLAISLVSEVVILVALATLLTFRFGRDQSIYAVVAREMLHGAAPYRDVFDFKPPGIYFLYEWARVIFGPAQWGIRAFEVLSLLVTLPGLIVLTRRYCGSPRTGLAAGALTCLLIAQQDYWYTAQPEGFGCPLVVWGLVLALSAEDGGRENGRFWRWAVAGVLFGASALLKPPLGGIGPILAVVAGGRLYRKARAAGSPVRWKAVLTPAGGMALGGVLPFVVTFAWFGAHGALHDLYEVLFVFTPRYTQLGWHESGSMVLLCLTTLGKWLTDDTNFVWMGLALLVVFRPASRERLLVGWLLVSIGVLLAGIALQAKFFLYHWNTTFPLTSLLAVLGASKLVRWCERRGQGAALGAMVLLAALALAPFRGSTFKRNRTFAQHTWLRIECLLGQIDRQEALDKLGEGMERRNRLTARYLAAKLPPASPLFVWGFEPEVYYDSGLPLASRYIYDVPLRAPWFTSTSRPILERELAQHPPAAIVVEHNNRLPMVVGNNRDSAEALQDFDYLRQLLARRYRFDISIRGLDVYLRR